MGNRGNIYSIIIDEILKDVQKYFLKFIHLHKKQLQIIVYHGLYKRILYNI